MYRLYKLGHDKFQIESKYEGSFEGSQSQVVTYSIIQLEIPFAELKIALDEMDLHGHDMADFGILKRFIYSDVSKRKVS